MVHGVLLVHKKAGGSSHSLVHSVRKVIGQKAVGHGGTLDPMAEGLMLILLGQGTKLSNYLLSNDKSYRFTFCLGTTTDTLDKTGCVISTQSVSLKQDQIEKCIHKAQGEMYLPVPLYSAVKVKGKKLYQYVRSNKPVSLPYRKMFFYDLKIIQIGCDKVEVEISCSKGSYIRSWVAFIGEQLGTGACLEKLLRLKSNPFELKSALTLEDVQSRLRKNSDFHHRSLLKNLKPAFIPLSDALPHIQPVSISETEEKLLSRGQISSNLLIYLKKDQKEVNIERKAKKIRLMCQSRLVALFELKPFQSPQILRVFLKDILQNE